jgi:hypothetical protein
MFAARKAASSTARRHPGPTSPRPSTPRSPWVAPPATAADQAGPAASTSERQQPTRRLQRTQLPTDRGRVGIHQRSLPSASPHPMRRACTRPTNQAYAESQAPPSSESEGGRLGRPASPGWRAASSPASPVASSRAQPLARADRAVVGVRLHRGGATTEQDGHDPAPCGARVACLPHLRHVSRPWLNAPGESGADRSAVEPDQAMPAALGPAIDAAVDRSKLAAWFGCDRLSATGWDDSARHQSWRRRRDCAAGSAAGSRCTANRALSSRLEPADRGYNTSNCGRIGATSTCTTRPCHPRAPHACGALASRPTNLR